MSTITTVDRVHSVYGHAQAETKLFKFTDQKISLVDTIFAERYGQTMAPVFSDNGLNNSINEKRKCSLFIE